MNRFWLQNIFAILVIVTVIPLAACSEDDDGGPAERIISLAPGNTEILFALGLGDIVVGVTEQCDYPPEAQWKTSIGEFSAIDLEGVIELEPDLVLAASIHAGTLVATLEEEGIDVLIIDPHTIEHVLMYISLVGVMTERDEDASLLTKEMEAEIKAITSNISATMAPPPNDIRFCYISSHDPLVTTGKATFTNDLIEMAGGANIFADIEGYFETDLETLIERNPGIIITPAKDESNDDSFFAWAKTEERLQEVSAYKHNRVYGIDADLITRPGPRIVDGLGAVAKLINPELFDDETVKIEFPERIISLAPSNTEILFALDLGDRVVGVTEYCDYPPEAQEKTKIGGFSTVDMEKVMELDPDLILATGMHEETTVPELERRGFEVIVLKPESITEVFDGIAKVGASTGADEIAANLITDMKNRLEFVASQVALLTEDQRPGVFYVTWHDPIWTLGKVTLTHELIEISGGVNVFADGDGNMETDLETVVWKNPQIIMASSGHGAADDSPLTWATTEERLAGIDAVQNGKIHGVDADLVTRPGPRIIDGLELISKYIHPELFDEDFQLR